MVGGAYLRDKNTCARTSTENVGGLIHEGGGIYAGRYGICTYMYHGRAWSCLDGSILLNHSHRQCSWWTSPWCPEQFASSPPPHWTGWSSHCGSLLLGNESPLKIAVSRHQLEKGVEYAWLSSINLVPRTFPLAVIDCLQYFHTASHQKLAVRMAWEWDLYSVHVCKAENQTGMPVWVQWLVCLPHRSSVALNWPCGSATEVHRHMEAYKMSTKIHS